MFLANQFAMCCAQGRSLLLKSVKMSKSKGMKFYCLPMEVVAYILGAILILINLGMISFRIYIISNKQWAVDKAELVDGVEEK